MKRIRGRKYDLLDDYMKIVQAVNDTGIFVAELEIYDDYKTIRKLKRAVWDIQENLRTFVKEKIEPIRLDISHGLRQEQQESEENL